MNYRKFTINMYSNLLDSEVDNVCFAYGNTILESNSRVIVNFRETEFSTLEEAKQYLRQQQDQRDIYEEIQKEQYQTMSATKIAEIIRTHHKNIRVTDTLIESYVELASSKVFTVDDVAFNLRQLNSIDRIIEGYVDYKLSDGSTVLISNQKQQDINNKLKQHHDVVSYMRESKENFLEVLNLLED